MEGMPAKYSHPQIQIMAQLQLEGTAATTIRMMIAPQAGAVMAGMVEMRATVGSVLEETEEMALCLTAIAAPMVALEVLP
jgi:hypothetical protein